MAIAISQSDMPPDVLTASELKQLVADINESVKVREFRFVQPFPEEVQAECSICIQILKTPQIVTCCGHRFCLQCIERVHHECPLCKAENFQYFPDKTLERQINQRNIYCLLRSDGCLWTGELCKFENHLNYSEGHENPNSCNFFPIQCEYCSTYVRRKNIDEHHEECSQRPSRCRFCWRTVSHDSLQAHYKVCLVSPVRCSNTECSKVISRNERMQHEKECPWKLVECKFKYAGCNTEVYRKNLEDHLQKNLEKHLDLLSKECLRLQEREVDLIRRNDLETFRLQVEVASLEQKIKNNGQISYLVISDLPDVALEEHKLKSRFGQYGRIERIDILHHLNSGIVVFSSPHSYQIVLDSKHAGIRLCKSLVQVNPVYTAKTVNPAYTVKTDDDSTDDGW